MGGWCGRDYFLKTAAKLGPASPSSMTGTVVISSRSAHFAAPKWSAARLLRESAAAVHIVPAAENGDALRLTSCTSEKLLRGGFHRPG